MPFPQAPVGTRRILGRWRQSGWLWCCGRSCWWCSLWPNEVVQRVQVGGGRGPVREGYKVVALLLKPSLGLFGLVSRHRVLLLHPGSATSHLIAPEDHHTLQHIQVHFGVDFQADFEDVRWLVKYCVTFRHDRRLLSLLRFVHNWLTSRWSAKKKKKKTGFH